MVYDKKGYPIYPGDILRSIHFYGKRNKKYYQYHMVIEEEGKLFIAHICYKDGKGVIERATTLSNLDTSESEIIQGYGPGDIISYEDREKNVKAIQRLRQSCNDFGDESNLRGVEE